LELCGFLEPRMVTGETVVAVRGTYYAFRSFFLLIDSLDTKNMVAKVQRLKPILLAEESDDSASGPVKSLAEQLSGKRGLILV
jgi:hypothetical protein